MPRVTLGLENAALRQQLAVYQRTQKRARLRPADRAFWILLRRLWPDWARSLVVVRPDTALAWHRRGFQVLWRRKSRLVGTRLGAPSSWRSTRGGSSMST